MKNKIIIVFVSIAIFLSGCIKDTLDRKPLNLISDADIWVSTTMVDVYMAALYDNIQIGHTGQNYQSIFTDEAATALQASPVLQRNYGAINRFLNTTQYLWIRRTNYFLERIKTATIPANDITQFTAECRFIRAYYYFDLVKKYGGMPIIEQVQDFTGNNLEELKVSRNTEDEVYSFILRELDAAIDGLPDTREAKNGNRATKMVAQALKSRAMLYAGSIAKYGTVQLNGLIGIPASRANFYFTEALKASNAVIQSNKYALYDKVFNPATQTGDPVKNYTDIFLDKNNKEIIFQRAYIVPDKAHGYDFDNLPIAFLSSNGSLICPLLELVESYEYVDGTPGILNVDGREFDSPDELFKNKDPRFAASIFRSGSPFIGRPIQMWAGVYDTDGKLYQTPDQKFPKDNNILQVGLDGPHSRGRYTKTGFYIRKYINQNQIINAANLSDQSYIDIRFAEVLLNYTEAALELGTNLPEALTAINLLRSRAGIKTLTGGELTMERLRNERKVELAFEDKRFWDMKRWRIAKSIFNNSFMHGLYPYLRYTGSGYKYQFKKITGAPLDEGLTRTFEEKDYYSNLSGYISTNSNIINNPGW